MTTKKELTALQKDIKAIGKKLERLLKAVEKSETKPTRASKAKPVKAKTAKKAPSKKAVKAKTAKKAPKEKAPAKQKATKITATDQVLNIINASEKGVDAPSLMKETGFNQKKVTNILHRSFKAGKIKRADKGIYVGVKEG
jgi:hypothetical protein